MHTQILTLRRPRLVRSCMLASLAILAAGATLAACRGPIGGPPPARQDCGTVRQGAIVEQSNPAAESCFAQAYTNCRQATLEYAFMGVDAGSTHTFTVAPGAFGGCSISDTVQSYVIPTNRQTTRTYTCSGLQHKDGGLLITGCGSEGDVFIPPASATYVPAVPQS